MTCEGRLRVDRIVDRISRRVGWVMGVSCARLCRWVGKRRVGCM